LYFFWPLRLSNTAIELVDYPKKNVSVRTASRYVVISGKLMQPEETVTLTFLVNSPQKEGMLKFADLLSAGGTVRPRRWGVGTDGGDHNDVLITGAGSSSTINDSTGNAIFEVGSTDGSRYNSFHFIP
jgi:hypothetical protein